MKLNLTEVTTYQDWSTRCNCCVQLIILKDLIQSLGYSRNIAPADLCNITGLRGVVKKPQEKMASLNSKKTETITPGGILKPKMADMEAVTYVKPSPFTNKCTTIESSICKSKNFGQVNYEEFNTYLNNKAFFKPVSSNLNSRKGWIHLQKKSKIWIRSRMEISGYSYFSTVSKRIKDFKPKIQLI